MELIKYGIEYREISTVRLGSGQSFSRIIRE